MRGTQAQARMDGGLAAPRRARPSKVHPIRWWVRHRLWLYPVLAALAGTWLGIVFVELPSPMARVLRGVAWQATAAEARTMLSTVLGITLTSLSIVLSLSMLVVQNAAGQYSPRLLRLFLHSAGIRLVIPVFVATSVFCLVAAQNFGFVSGAGRAPRPALSMALLLLVVCEGALVYQVLHTLQLMRVERLVQWIRQEALRVARTMERFRRWDTDLPAVMPARPEGAWPLLARRNGFIVAVDERALLAVATARGLVVHVSHAIGEPVIRGAEVGWVEATGRASPASRTASEALLTRAILLERWRDADADVALGVRQLVDMALKALSPGVNDLYTAVEVVDQLTFLLCELTQMHLGPRVLVDEAGSARVFLHALAMRDYLVLTTDQILRYGATEPTVVIRLLRLAVAVGQRARTAEDRQAARETLHRVLAEAERAQAGSPWLEPLRRYAGTLEQAWAGRWLPPLPAPAF